MGAIDFTPAELAKAINDNKVHVDVTYRPDFRQKIADTWPKSLDDSRAREDWVRKSKRESGNYGEMKGK